MIVDHECIECFVLFLNPTNAKLCFSDLKMNQTILIKFGLEGIREADQHEFPVHV